MATKKKAAKPAKKTGNVKKIAPAKKTASKTAHSSVGNKSAKKSPAAKSIAKPAAKKVASAGAKKSATVQTKKTIVSNLSKPAARTQAPAAVSKTHVPAGKVHSVQPAQSVHTHSKPTPVTVGKATVTSVGKTAIATVGKTAIATVGKTAIATVGKTAIGTVGKTAAAAPLPTAPVASKPEAKKPVPPTRPVKVVIPEIKTKTVRKYEPEFTKSVLDTPQEEQTGPTMRYSDAELGEFRELINRKLDAAKKELAYLQGLITRKDEMGGDNDDARYMTMEDGSMSMEREQLSQMASRQITFIDHLEKALMRIENKTYGICRVTGKLIDKARLRAVPHATLSIEAKQMMNK
jgi:RNA polymerase-binding transcription factor DksA